MDNFRRLAVWATLFCFILFDLLPAHFSLQAWWVVGHGRIAEAAVRALPEDLPEFFRQAGPALGQMAGDPDLWKNPGTKHLRASEGPEHFLDLEDLGGNEIPEDRYQAIQLIIRLGKKPEKVGLLPHALMDSYEKLACCFHDLREKPDDPVRRWRCLVYAGVLAHYAGDCAMPLHTTRDYDGRIREGKPPLQKGIHARLDAFPEKHGVSVEDIAKGLKLEAVENPWTRLLSEFRSSHRLVDEAYRLDQMGGFQEPGPESRAFVLGRCKAAAKFTAELWVAAWEKSKNLPKPY